MPSRLEARNTSSFTSRGAASASIQIFRAYPSNRWSDPRSSQLRVCRTLRLELAGEIARSGPQELPGGTHVDLWASSSVSPGTWIRHDPCTRLGRQIGNSGEGKTRLHRAQVVGAGPDHLAGCKARSSIGSTCQRCGNDKDQEQSTHEGLLK